MGIKFFKTYCKKNNCETTFKLFERSNHVFEKDKQNTVIIVDSSSLLFEVFGRFQHNLEDVFDFIIRLK